MLNDGQGPRGDIKPILNMRSNGHRGQDEVDTSMPEYRPLLQSTPAEKKYQRKQSTFVVTPVSLLDTDIQGARPTKVI